MDSIDDTKHHVRIWHRDFWKLNVVSFFLAVSVYMQLPVFVKWMAESDALSDAQVSVVVGIYGLGLFMLGSVCSYLIQRYRRNKVCILAMLLVAALLFCVAYFKDNLAGETSFARWVFIASCLLRFLMGAFFGLAYMILNSTLIVDSCESSRRTVANVVSAWSHRLAVAVGPLFGIFLLDEAGISYAMYVSALLCVVSVGILSSVSFPFRAPEETLCMFSTDRFFMLMGMPLVFPLFLVSVYTGMMVMAHHEMVFYGCLAVGFFLAIAFLVLTGINRIKRMYIYIGYILLVASGVCFAFPMLCSWLADVGMVFLGVGIAMVTAFFHVWFTDAADHCQRGTAQSTYFLSFESGFSVGAALVLLKSIDGCVVENVVALAVLSLSLFVYLLYTGRWLRRKKL